MRAHLIGGLVALATSAGVLACSGAVAIEADLPGDGFDVATMAMRDASALRDASSDGDAGDADAAPAEPAVVLLKDYGVYDLNGAVAAPPLQIATCRELARQAEGVAFEADVDPFLGFDTATNAWASKSTVDGKTVDVAPRRVRIVEGRVRLDDGRYGKLACHIPVAWRALVLDATVAIDPVHRDVTNRIVLPNGGIGGYVVKGGVYRGFNDRVTSDPFDVWVAWYLRGGVGPTFEASLRAAKSIPARYAVALADEVTEATNAGRQPLLALGFASNAAFTDTTAWALNPESNRTTFAGWGLVPAEAPPATDTPESSLNLGHLLRVGNLVAFDARTGTKLPCGRFELDPRKRCDGIVEAQLGDLIDRTLTVGRPLWARIVWQGAAASEPLLTTVRVQGDGTVVTESTVLAPAFTSLGLPARSVWRTM